VVSKKHEKIKNLQNLKQKVLVSILTIIYAILNSYYLSSLEGSWKCVGWDNKRNVNKFVFFNEDGTGYWAVQTPDCAKIDPKKR
jgi:hypothetical protein